MNGFEIVIAVIAVIALIPATWIPLHIFRVGNFNKAAYKFKEAFIEEIKFIDRTFAVDRAGRDIPEILADAFDKHEHALIAFKSALGKRKRDNIEKAWKKYTGEEIVTGKYTFRQYTTYGKFKEAENIRKLSLSRIGNLLKFADPKH